METDIYGNHRETDIDRCNRKVFNYCKRFRRPLNILNDTGLPLKGKKTVVRRWYERRLLLIYAQGRDIDAMNDNTLHELEESARILEIVNVGHQTEERRA